MEPGDSPRGLQRGGEQPLPKPVRDLITKARTSWLKNTEVVDLLQNYSKYRFQLNRETPICPPGGTLYLFNRRVTRFFRRDGHNWRKKADGKTIRETHEKLKVGNKEALNCYYAHADQDDQLQRRCYWMLEGDDSIVLVHYLAGNAAARLRHPGAVPLTAANLAMQPRNMEAPSSSDATSQSSYRSESQSHRSTASSYSDLGEIARAGSAPDGLGGFTFGSGSVRRASDGRCHFTITTGNTQPGPDAMPLAQEGMGALVVSNSRDGSGGAAPAAADVRANSMPSTLGEALQRAQMEQHMAQIAAGAGRTSGFWGQSGGASGRDHMYNGVAAAQQAAAAAAAQHQRPPGQWQQQLPQQAAADAAAHLLAWQQQQQQAALAAQQQQMAAQQQQHQQHPVNHAFGAELQQLQQHANHANSSGSGLNHGGSSNHSSGFGGGLPPSLGSLPWQAPPSAGWKQPADPRREQLQQHTLGGMERPRLPRAGISAFAAPQVQRTADQSPFGAAVLVAPTGMEGVQAHQNSGFQMASFGVGNSFGGR